MAWRNVWITEKLNAVLYDSVIIAKIQSKFEVIGMSHLIG